MTDEKQCLHAIVHSQVQGVSFRYYTNMRAEELDITGWVRNLPDGTVEVMAEGTRAQLDRLLDFLRQGPTGAQVSSVEANWQAASGHFANFSIH